MLDISTCYTFTSFSYCINQINKLFYNQLFIFTLYLGAEMYRFLLLFLFSLLVFSTLNAEQRKSKSEMLKAIRHYQRLMESAQPRPDERYTKIDKIP